MAEISGIYLHYEGDITNCDIVQQYREIVFVRESGCLRYRDCSGNYWYLGSPDILDLSGVQASRRVNTSEPLLGGNNLSEDIVLSIKQAGLTESGFLSTADWNLFYNKEDKSHTHGLGTSGYLSKYITQSRFGNSILIENNNMIGVNTSPTANLDVNGNVRIRTFNNNETTPSGFFAPNESGIIAFRTLEQVRNDIGAPASGDLHDALTVVDSSTIDFTLTNQQLTGSVIDSGVNHNATLNYVSNEHINHGSVSIIAGSGLQGGGTLAASRTINLNHLGIQALVDPNQDRIMFWDDSENATKWLEPGPGMSISGTILSNTITQYTDEMAQDSVGNILYNTGSITFTYNDESNSITANVVPSYSGFSEYYRKYDLQTSGNSQVHWGNITNLGLVGTTYRIPRYTSSSTIGDSNIYTNAAGTMVGIGVSPTVAFQIAGETQFNNTVTIVSGSYTTTLLHDSTGLKIGHNSAARDIQIQTNSLTRLTVEAGGDTIVAGNLELPTVAAAAGNFDRFLVKNTSTNAVEYRTSEQVLGDIGADNYLRLYGPSSGVLITTSILGNSDRMFYLDIRSNQYSEVNPTQIIIQGYNYNGGSAIINTAAKAVGYSPTISAFIYGGYLCFWFPHSNAFQTYYATCYTQSSTKNHIVSITDAIKPTSGLTREVSIVPVVAVAGTAHRIPRFGTSSSLENSPLYTNSANTMIGVGQSPDYPLNIGYNAGGYQVALRDSAAANRGYIGIDSSYNFNFYNSYPSANISLQTNTSTPGNILLNVSGGLVGIGSTPDVNRKLTVYSNLSSIAATFKTNSIKSTISFLDLTTTDNTYVRIGADGNNAIIYTGGNETVRIDSTGRMGVGLTPGTGSAMVDVGYSSSSTYSASTSGYWPGYYNTAFAGVRAVNSSSTNSSFISYVGVVRNASANYQSGGMSIVSIPGSTGYTPAITFWQRTGSNTCDERMRIDNSGKIGINKSDPSTILDVNGEVTIRTINALATTATTFLTHTTGVIQSRTAAQVLSDIGAQAMLTTGNLTASGAILIDNTRQVIGGTAAISHSTAAGYKHIPSGGTSGQFLKYSSDGTAAWTAHGLTYSDVGAAPALSLTQYRIPRAATTTTLGDSNIYTNAAGTVVGIGTTGGSANVNISGSMEFVRSGTQQFKNVCDYFSHLPNTTGTLVFTMPVVRSNHTFQIRIRGYQYSSDNGRGAWEIILGGYNWDNSNKGKTEYYNYSVEFIGSPPFSYIRLATTGTNDVIMLGNLITNWAYPKVVVSDVIVGYDHVSSDSSWGQGWSSSIVTSESAYSSIVTLYPSIYTDYAGRIGIGNYNPAELNGYANNLVIGNGVGNKGLTIYSNASNWGSIYFAHGLSGAQQYAGVIAYNHLNNYMTFYTSGSEKIRIDTYGNIGIYNNDIESWWSSFRAIEFPRSSIMYNTISAANQIGLLSNLYYDGSWKYKSTGAGAAAFCYDGTFFIRTAYSGSADTNSIADQVFNISTAGDVTITKHSQAGTAAGPGLILTSTAANSYPYINFINDAQNWRIFNNGSANDEFTIYDVTSTKSRIIVYPTSVSSRTDFISDYIYITATTLAANVAVIHTPNGTFADYLMNTNSGSDTKCLRLGGGGDVTLSRGGHVYLYGNNHSTYPGDVFIKAGYGGDIYIQTETITSASADITIKNNSSTGNINLESTNTSIKTPLSRYVFNVNNTNQFTFSSTTTLSTINFVNNTTSGVFSWLATDMFYFEDDVMLQSNEKLYFRDTDIYINSTNDGYLDLVADTGVRINGVTISPTSLLTSKYLSLVNSNVSHPFTGYTSSDTYCYIGPRSSTTGGTQIYGFSDTNAEGLVMAGYVGATSISAYPCTIQGGKWDGSTASTMVADSEPLFRVINNGTGRLFMTGNGYTGFGGSPSYRLSIIDSGSTVKFAINDYFSVTGDGVIRWGTTAASSNGQGYMSWDTGIAYMGGTANNSLYLRANNATAMVINVSGNIGVGTTDIESWNSGYRAIEFINTSILAGVGSTNDIYILSNIYYDGDGALKYKKSNNAAMLRIYNSALSFQVAASGTMDTTLTLSEILGVTSAGILNTYNDIIVASDKKIYSSNFYIEFDETNGRLDLVASGTGAKHIYMTASASSGSINLETTGGSGVNIRNNGGTFNFKGASGASVSMLAASTTFDINTNSSSRMLRVLTGGSSVFNVTNNDVYSTALTSFTPTIGSTTGGDTIPTYSTVHCYYRTIGKMVDFWITLMASAGTAGAGSGALTITLPVGSLDTTLDDYYCCIGNGFIQNNTNRTNVTAYIHAAWAGSDKIVMSIDANMSYLVTPSSQSAATRIIVIRGSYMRN